MISYLSIKLTGLPVSKLKHNNIPQNAITYNIVEGLSAKKGKYSVISFFDSLGNLIKIRSIHIKNSNITKLTSEYSADKMVINSTVENNENIICRRKKIIHPDLFFTKETILPDEEYSIHNLGKLRKKYLPKIISYITNWDGQKPVLEYQNVNKRLQSDTGLELLPLWISSLKEHCIQHLARYRIREENLEDIAPLAKSISLDELIEQSESAKKYLEIKGKISGVTDSSSGQVYIVRGSDDNVELIDTIAHEYQHVKDISDTLRLEDNYKLAETYFEMLSMQKEPIKKSDPAYEILWKLLNEKSDYTSSCNAGHHDDMLAEKRAIAKGKEQTDLFYKIIEAVKDLLS